MIVWRLKMSPLLYLCSWSLLVSAAIAAPASDGTTRELDQTPSWAVAGVCAVIILISLGLEKVLHKLGAWFTERQKKALYEALEKVKAELMILGFISLLLTFGQVYILKICIPIKVADTLLPCPAQTTTAEGHRRKLLWYDRRFLAAGSSTVSCKEGKVPLISINGLHQLHILIFFLAVFHVLYSFITMMLGRLKIRGWKHWEQETSVHDYEMSKAKFVLSHETSFVKAHTSFWTTIPIFFYVGCFFRQFFRSVSKSDYTTLRNGFISVHLAPGSKFNFQKYIKRSLEDDFQVVVGVSPVLWASFVLFLLLNVHGWQTLLWSSLIPVIIILAVGTKLQAIMTKMALEITERHAVVQGIPLVQGSDQYFWLGRPKLLLYLIHFSLFQNAFQITYFFWIWYSFGLRSCFHSSFEIVIARVILGVVILCVCSYITLPLYALVTQMGSRMKASIFDEQTSKALKNWRMAVKKKKGGNPSTRTLGSPSASPMHPSGATLHQYKIVSPATRSAAYVSNEASDYEVDPSSRHLETMSSLIIRVESDDQKKDALTEQIAKKENEF